MAIMTSRVVNWRYKLADKNQHDYSLVVVT